MKYLVTQEDIQNAGGCKTIETDEYTYNYRIIKGYEAKEYNGDLTGWKKGTPDGDRVAIEEEQIRKEDGRTRYSNNW